MFSANGDEHEDWKFSKLHKIVLGLDGGDLASELAQYPEAVNSTDSAGMSALLWAARKGDNVAVELLLKANADPNMTDGVRSTAFLEAAKSGSVACAKLLLAANANVRHGDASGKTTLHYAAEYAKSKDMILLLVAAGATINKPTDIGGSPLFFTCFYDNIIAATTLLDLGADTEFQDPDGDTPLCEALFRRADRVTKLLLERGACYTLIASNGDSIPHLAAKSGGTATLDILLAAELKGIDPYMQNRDGKTAIRIAQERSPMPPGFLEKMYELVMGIDTRNLRLAQVPKQDRHRPAIPPVGPSRAVTITEAFSTSWDMAKRLSRYCSNRALVLRALGQSALQQYRFIGLSVGWAIGIIAAVMILLRRPSSTAGSESRQMQS